MQKVLQSSASLCFMYNIIILFNTFIPILSINLMYHPMYCSLHVCSHVFTPVKEVGGIYVAACYNYMQTDTQLWKYSNDRMSFPTVLAQSIPQVQRGKIMTISRTAHMSFMHQNLILQEIRSMYGNHSAPTSILKEKHRKHDHSTIVYLYKQYSCSPRNIMLF